MEPPSKKHVTGGRFKKEVIIDGQSYLLLIRDEGGAPEMQVSVFWSFSFLGNGWEEYLEYFYFIAIRFC